MEWNGWDEMERKEMKRLSSINNKQVNKYKQRVKYIMC